jgi:hypothetical protein
VFGIDLTSKTSKIERELVMLTHDEALKLYNETECKHLEDYIIELGENSKEF